MYVVLDIETKNLGSDIMKDNEQILSIQLGNDIKQKLYYHDSKDPQWTLATGEKQIASLLSQGFIFAGYNIKNFDIPLLKRFLGVEIPKSNIFEVGETPRVAELNKMKKYRLEEVCAECGIDASHKLEMNKKAEEYKVRQDIKAQANVKAKELVRNKGWSFDFALKYALDKIAGGHAIFNAYLEFVESGGQKNTLFYKYAIGDVISEYQLLKALKY
jgi:hypothetical protein